MKVLPVILLIISTTISFGQQQKFLIEGRIVDQTGNPVTDVYIVNLNSNEKDISHTNGFFAIWVSPTDTLVLSHISYFRETIKAHTLMINPSITLKSEYIDIPEIRVSPNKISDLARANQNLIFLKKFQAPAFVKIQEEYTPVTMIMTAHNDQMRVEAASVSLARFSPSANLEKLFIKLKRKDRVNQYYSTRKSKKEIKN